ncbi:AraC family transcriptional regulator [Yoonia sp. GPGPB17]|uniref:helix-turn-helix domain-containing protein n=1 Tax=Yoonia sp. GPGPB17 TaxID=3026147 RepID=UPI0030C322F5
MFLPLFPMALSALALFAGASVLLLSPRKNLANRVLATFFFISAFAQAMSVLNYRDDSDGFQPVMILMQLLPLVIAFLFGPLILLYTRLLTGQQRHIGGRDFLRVAWAPTTVAIICTPLTIGAIWFGFFSDDGALRPGAIGYAAGMAVILTLLVIMPFTYIYVFMCWRLLIAHLDTLKDAFSYIQDKALSWLRWFLVLLSVQATMAAFEIYDQLTQSGLSSPTIMDIGEFFLLFIMSLLALNHVVQSRERQEVAPQPEQEPSKYERSALTAQQAGRVAQQLDQTMARDGLYRDPFLNLSTLSARAHVKSHRVSQVLNTHIGRSFFDYVNGWRIDAAKRQLADEQLTIVAIFQEVGFNSRSTFYTAFKKETGLTPTEYRRRLRSDQTVQQNNAAV